MLHGELREAIIAKELHKLGHDAKVVRVRGGTQSVVVSSFGDAVDVLFFPQDEPNEDPHEITSGALLKYLVAELPDMLVLKGIDYRIAAEALQALSGTNARCAVIIGGVSEHPLIGRAGLVFTESARQADLIRSTVASDVRVEVLAKYLDWPGVKSAISKASVAGKTYDIVNVGFFEPRKNQIGLSLFYGKYKIAYVGHGPTMDAVRAAAEGHQGIAFLGNLSNSSVLEVVASSRIMAHTSQWEGVPRVLIEAQACGCPAIAYKSAIQGDMNDAPGVRLIDECDLVGTVDDLLSDPGRLQALSVEAHRWASELYGPESFSRAAHDLIEFAARSEQAFQGL